MRPQSLNIGAAIFQILTTDSDVSELVGQKVYPLVAPEGTPFPFVVYTRSGISSARDKDSYFYSQDVMQGVIVCTDDYTEGVNIAMAIAKAMQFGEKTVTVGEYNIDIMESVFDSGTEDYINNVFVQGLIFHLKVR